MANRTVTKRELCEKIAKQTGQTQVVTKQIIQCFLDEVITGLSQGDRLELRNFGVFDTRLQKARKARNPRAKPGTDPVVYVGPRAVVTFKVGKDMQAQAQEALQHLQQKES